MNEVYRAAVELQNFCEARHWHFCFIGGLAVQRWGNPCQTEDADGRWSPASIMNRRLLTKSWTHSPRALPMNGKAQFCGASCLSSRAKAWIVLALGGLDLEERSVARASDWDVEQMRIRTCSSAEDLIVHKAFAGRDIDWAEVGSVIDVQGRKLNVDQIWSELRPLAELKEAPDILSKLQRLFDEHLD